MKGLARNTDPLSSHIAAGNVDTKTQREDVLNALRSVGGSVTAKELSISSDIDYYQIQRRVSELANLGLIKRGEMVRDTFTGRQATLLELVK